MATGADLQFAMGELTGQTRALAEEQGRMREAHEGIPAKVVALLDPRFQTIDIQLKDHEGRIRSIEKRDWKVYGGAAVVFAIVGVLVGGWHPIHIPI